MRVQVDEHETILKRYQAQKYGGVIGVSRMLGRGLAGKERRKMSY